MVGQERVALLARAMRERWSSRLAELAPARVSGFEGWAFSFNRRKRGQVFCISKAALHQASMRPLRID